MKINASGNRGGFTSSRYLTAFDSGRKDYNIPGNDIWIKCIIIFCALNSMLFFHRPVIFLYCSAYNGKGSPKIGISWLCDIKVNACITPRLHLPHAEMAPIWLAMLPKHESSPRHGGKLNLLWRLLGRMCVRMTDVVSRETLYSQLEMGRPSKRCEQ